MSLEVGVFVAALTLIVLAGAAVGLWLGKKATVTPLVAAGLVATTVVVVLLAIGLVKGNVQPAAAAAASWLVIMSAIAADASRVGRRKAAIGGGLGGLLAVQAALITFVVTRFSAQDAPREYVLLWLPAALTGAVKDLGEPVGAADEPLWLRISQEAGPMLWLLSFATAVIVACVVQPMRQPSAEPAGEAVS
ncbi:hypothetical protein SAMN05444365_109114 [Micromonospora pattaloongensis]|uniref:Uncharacterized protein n=1 Tax=Micromonospora pattaloongensis TaxID=405436 RepID=A0A1H3RVF8_9ACTN|nr:hypothetical protein [Micromonospora pattaloongensis]SDZ29642.1 hypothetical protein SAMN05444365_109114 [Micromonospora pattaloongensis]